MPPPRKPLIAGNWKMNLNHLEAIALTQKIAFSLKEEHLTAVEAVVLPPFVDLRSVQTLVDGMDERYASGAPSTSQYFRLDEPPGNGSQKLFRLMANK